MPFNEIGRCLFGFLNNFLFYNIKKANVVRFIFKNTPQLNDYCKTIKQKHFITYLETLRNTQCINMKQKAVSWQVNRNNFEKQVILNFKDFYIASSLRLFLLENHKRRANWKCSSHVCPLHSQYLQYLRFAISFPYAADKPTNHFRSSKLKNLF